MSDLVRMFGFGQRPGAQSAMANSHPKEEQNAADIEGQRLRPEHQRPHSHSQSRHRPSPISRMSSYLSLIGSKDSRVDLTASPFSTAPTVDWGEPNTKFEDENQASSQRDTDSLKLNETDRTWHNPSLKQMVEALQVTIMSAPTPAPIPAKYSSYVLHLIEGICQLQHKLDGAKAEIREATGAHERDLEQFTGMSEEWIVREKQFKAEILRLEKLLARHSRDGMETVALARGNSLVNRSDTRRFVAKIHRVSGGGGAGEFVCQGRLYFADDQNRRGEQRRAATSQQGRPTMA